MVVSTGKMIHAMRDIQQKFLRSAPAFPFGSDAESLIDIDKKLSVQTWILRRD
jgi:hypothetical protein